MTEEDAMRVRSTWAKPPLAHRWADNLLFERRQTGFRMWEPGNADRPREPDEIWCVGTLPYRLCAVRFGTRVLRTRCDDFATAAPDLWEEATEQDAILRYRAACASFLPF